MSLEHYLSNLQQFTYVTQFLCSQVLPACRRFFLLSAFFNLTDEFRR